MRKRVSGRQFNKDINQRKALFRSLIRSLILNERIKTTEAKAKAIRSEVEKIITKAKIRGEDAKYHLQKHLDQDTINKVVTDLMPRFKDRDGGYVRIMRLGSRVKDNASMVLMEWVDGPIPRATEDSTRKTNKENKEEVEKKVEVKTEKKKDAKRSSPKVGKTEKKDKKTEKSKKAVKKK